MSEAPVALRRALISVYEKTGIIELARSLEAAGCEIISTGSTAKQIAAAGIKVTPVETVTGFAECLDGRVKTLHPRIHAGILARRDSKDHMQQLAQMEVTPIDLVVCNLYPFAAALKDGLSREECVELIDIGGPSMVRAAAKNHDAVAVVADPSDYQKVIEAAAKGGFTLAERRELAAKAFAITAAYDAKIAAWLADDIALPQLERVETLRYGENPHQQAVLYRDPETSGVAAARQLGGKAMSYNNYTDADAAWRAVWDHPAPAVAIMKHANPCGIARGETVADAHAKAHACDPLSAFGGVVAVNDPVTLELAEQLKPIFTEVIIAPAYEDAALEVLQTKKALRILQLDPPSEAPDWEWKFISGGALAQTPDHFQADGDRCENWQLVAGKEVDAATKADLEFAWRAARAVRSNAIIICKDGASLGVGMGQVNRVDAAKLAVARANSLSEDKHRSRGAVAASDAFFPFADGMQILIDAGVTAIVEPGGSIRDEEVIEAAAKAGISLYFTGARHFAH